MTDEYWRGLEKAAIKNPDDPQAAYSVAAAYRRLGQSQERMVWEIKSNLRQIIGARENLYNVTIEADGIWIRLGDISIVWKPGRQNNVYNSASYWGKEASYNVFKGRVEPRRYRFYVDESGMRELSGPSGPPNVSYDARGRRVLIDPSSDLELGPEFLLSLKEAVAIAEAAAQAESGDLEGLKKLHETVRDPHLR